jgi:hypothetical protein
MPQSAVSLNDAQVAVLRWIAAGSPASVMDGYTHRISASALRTRDLVRIAGRGATWRAELTNRGREQLERLERELSARTTDGRNGNVAEPLQLAHRTAPRATAAPASRPKPLSKTEQLVADVLAAGGRLTLPDETAPGGVNWRQRAYAAQRHGKVPAGKRLTVSWTNAGFEIELLEGETGNELGAEAVPVPARLSKYHPVAQEFRNRTSLHEVSRKALPRVLRIVHGLAKRPSAAATGSPACACARTRTNARSGSRASTDSSSSRSTGTS